MKNWMSRLAIFAVLGAVLSSTVLVGCSGGEEEEAAATPTAVAPADGE